MKLNPKIVLCLPTLGQYKKENILSLITSVTPQNPFVGFVIVETSLLPFSRNYCLRAAFDKHPDLTHIMFIDDDMLHFNSWHIIKLFQDDKDVVSAIMTFRSPPYSVVSDFDKSIDVTKACEDKELVQAKHTGLAFTLIKREVLEAIKEETPNGSIWFTMDREPRNNFEDEKNEYIKEQVNQLSPNQYMDDFKNKIGELFENAIAFGQTSYIGSDVIGEDIAFCSKVQKCGFEIWVDCGVIVSHLGNIPFNICNQVQYRDVQECIMK